MTIAPRTSRLPATWLEFAAFLRRPALGQPSGLRHHANWTTLGAMLALNLSGLAVLLVLLSGWQALTGIEGPAAFEDFPPQYLFPAAVLAAPLLEESAFRGWLSGRPRALWLLGCLIAATGLMLLAADLPLGSAAGLGLVLLAGLVGWLVLRKRATPDWFTHRFAPIFFASAGVFAVMHVFNYSHPGLLTLPMVLPQLWAGLTLGFVRNRVGLVGGMLVHGTSNAIALGLAALGGELH
jgi:membrane protease YdiL (CAAX protease family)